MTLSSGMVLSGFSQASYTFILCNGADFVGGHAQMAAGPEKEGPSGHGRWYSRVEPETDPRGLCQGVQVLEPRL